MIAAWPWLAVAALGAYHGVDPSMGWLFAVALGLQSRSRSRVVGALVPIAAGHLISIALVVALIGGAREFAAAGVLRPVGACALVLFGIFRFFYPRAHPRWVGMKVSGRDLVVWSFLMSTAHGAGLMLFPILMEMPAHARAAAAHSTVMAGTAASAAHMAAMGHLLAGPGGWPLLIQGAAVVLLHTGAMLLVMGAVSIVVYDRVGLKILRSAWVNLDTIWAGALVAAGLLSFVA